MCDLLVLFQSSKEIHFARTRKRLSLDEYYDCSKQAVVFFYHYFCLLISPRASSYNKGVRHDDNVPAPLKDKKGKRDETVPCRRMDIPLDHPSSTRTLSVETAFFLMARYCYNR